MGGYGELPITGIGALTFGALTVNTPWIAVAGIVLIVGGGLMMRKFRPIKLNPTGRRDR